MTQPGPLLIVSGPSGSGKSITVDRLLAMPDLPLRRSVSATTRPPRPGETDGIDYWFVTPAEFETELARDGFLEWARVHDHCYGTPRGPVDLWRAEGLGVVLVIDVQGAAQVRRRYPDCVSVFLCPSTLVELERRLRGRKSDSEVVIQTRLSNARSELARADEYTYQIANDDLEQTLGRLREVLIPLFDRGTHAG